MAKKRSHSEKQEEEEDHLLPNPKLACKPNDNYSKAQPESSVSPSTKHAKKKKKKKKSTKEKNLSPSSDAKDQEEEQEEHHSPNPKPTEHNSEPQAQAQTSSALRKSGRKRVTKKSSTHDDFSEEDEDEDEKKSGKKKFERIWSEEDEITILKGLADFPSKTTTKNEINIIKFYKRKKKSLQLKATYTQVKNKVRKLGQKYKINEKKLKNGVNRKFIFSKPHDRILFNLSMKVWGNPNDKNVLEHDLGSCSANNDVVKMVVEFIEKSENEELKRELKELRFKEMELFVRRCKMMRELSELIWESYNNSMAN